MIAGVDFPLERFTLWAVENVGNRVAHVDGPEGGHWGGFGVAWGRARASTGIRFRVRLKAAAEGGGTLNGGQRRSSYN